MDLGLLLRRVTYVSLGFGISLALHESAPGDHEYLCSACSMFGLWHLVLIAFDKMDRDNRAQMRFDALSPDERIRLIRETTGDCSYSLAESIRRYEV